jgi:hypothetical protein
MNEENVRTSLQNIQEELKRMMTIQKEQSKK